MNRARGQFFSAGVAAGLVLFLLEATDQSITLSPFFQSFRERLLYLSSLTFSITAAIGASLVVGLGSFVWHRIFRTSTEGTKQRQTKHTPLGRKMELIRGLVLLIYAIMLTALFASPFRSDMMRLFIFYAPYVESGGRVFVGYATVALLALGFSAVLYLGRQVFILLTESFSRRARITLLAVVVGAVALSYRFDSRFYFGLYETSFHRALFCFELAASCLFGLAMMKMMADGALFVFWRQWINRALVIIGLMAIVATAVGLARLGSDESLRALFMHRSVVARRYLSFLRWVSDRDGDGFSPILGGGDCNDANPSIHPAAVEIPGNGKDENCLGGDLIGNVQDEGVLIETQEAAAGPEGVHRRDGRNVVLITIDALRADHLGCYGYKRETSPNIDRFASRATQFLTAISQATSTGHSFASMLRSAYGEAVFDEDRKTLMQILSHEDYRTGFIQTIDMVRQLSLQRPYRFAAQEGVDVNLHPRAKPAWSADELTDQALDYLRTLLYENRQFVWIHYFDPHDPYRKHADFNFGGQPADLYDGEIANMDRGLGRLFAFLMRPEIADKTLIIFTADHGEAFFEHGQHRHASMSYQEVIHVPLLIRYPERKPEKVTTPVSLVDVAPTILRFAGIEPPKWYEGRDLFSPGGRARRPIFSETARTTAGPIYFNYAMIEGQWKIIYDFVANTFELYNLRQDPAERKNLIEVDRAKAAALKGELTHWMDRKSRVPIHSGEWSLAAVLE